MPLARLAVEMLGADVAVVVEVVVMEKALVVLMEFESYTWMVKEYVEAMVGVP